MTTTLYSQPHALSPAVADLGLVRCGELFVGTMPMSRLSKIVRRTNLHRKPVTMESVAPVRESAAASHLARSSTQWRSSSPFASRLGGRSLLRVERQSSSTVHSLREVARTTTFTPNQAMQRTASKAATDVLCVCHPRFGCVVRFTGLAVADLVSR